MRPVVICGFGEIGQTVANMLESPFAISLERGRVPYVAFDMSPTRLEAARAAGFNVMYGNAIRPQVTPHLFMSVTLSLLTSTQVLLMTLMEMPAAHSWSLSQAWLTFKPAQACSQVMRPGVLLAGTETGALNLPKMRVLLQHVLQHLQELQHKGSTF